MLKISFTKLTVLVFIGGLLFSLLPAQNFFLQSVPENTTQFEVNFLHPAFKGNYDLSAFSGIYDVSLCLPVNRNIYINLSLPYIVVNKEYPYYRYGDKGNSIGNIYLGAQITPRDSVKKGSGPITSVGLFLPTVSDKKFSSIFVGISADMYQLQKYTPNTLTIFGNVAYHKKNTNGFTYGFELGPNMCIPTKGEGRDGELYLHYGMTAGMQFTNLSISAELLGIVILTEDMENFSDRFTHSIVFGTQWTGSRIQPGIFYKVYLEKDYRDTVSGVLGIKLGVKF